MKGSPMQQEPERLRYQCEDGGGSPRSPHHSAAAAAPTFHEAGRGKCLIRLREAHQPYLVAMDQNEKAFQKQDAVFLGSKRLLTKKSKKAARYWRNIGLGFQVPKEAKEGHFVDKKCPFTGNVSIRGAILKGMCISTKMKRTIIIRRNYLHYIKKFHRFEKRQKPFELTKVIQLVAGVEARLPNLDAHQTMSMVKSMVILGALCLTMGLGFVAPRLTAPSVASPSPLSPHHTGEASKFATGTAVWPAVAMVATAVGLLARAKRSKIATRSEALHGISFSYSMQKDAYADYESFYAAEVGYLVDGTDMLRAGNLSVQAGAPAPVSSMPSPAPPPVAAPTPVAASFTSTATEALHGISFSYSMQKDAYADYEFLNDVQIPVGTAGPRPRAPDPDLNSELPIPVGNAGPQPRAPDPSGHCRTSTASSRSQWATPDLNGELQIPVGTAGPQRRAPDPSGHCRTSTASSRSQLLARWHTIEQGRQLHQPSGDDWTSRSFYAAEVGYLVDGTDMLRAGNLSVQGGAAPPAPAPAAPVPVAAAFVGSSAQTQTAPLRHSIGFAYAVQKDAYVDLTFGNDVGYLPDGTPMNRAGNCINHPETIGPDPHAPGSPLPRALFVNDVGYLPDGTPMNKAGNCINHPETIGPDPHSPGSALPPSAYAADVGYLVDGTPLDAAGNNADDYISTSSTNSTHGFLECWAESAVKRTLLFPWRPAMDADSAVRTIDSYRAIAFGRDVRCPIKSNDFNDHPVVLRPGKMPKMP
eukprot:s657_g21.t1